MLDKTKKKMEFAGFNSVKFLKTFTFEFVKFLTLFIRFICKDFTN